MEWIFLAGGVVTEVAATCALRLASAGRTRWYGLVVAGYVTAFVMLTLALDAGMALGVAYGIWSAVGVALTAVASRVLFDEPLTLTMASGILLIAAGVFMIELGAA